MRTSPPTPASGAAAWRRTLAVKERYLAAGDPDQLPPATCGVRREIVSSWRRCLLSGVDAGGTDLPRDEGAVPPDRLVRAARPIADRLADQLAGMRVWAFLADRECRLIWHVTGTAALTPQLEARGAFPGARFAEDVVGTNGLGTAVEERRPFVVAGAEHFRAYESNATTAGAPVHDPLTGRLVGLLNVNCPYTSTNGLLLPFVTELARSIEARLHATASMPEQELLDEFMRISKRGPAVVALSQELFIANAAARTLLCGVDVELLRTWACDPAADGRERTAELRLRPDMVVTAHCRPLAEARHRAAVVVLTPAAPARAPSPAAGLGPVPAARRDTRAAAPARLVEQLSRAYAARLPVVLRGERGTGKTTLARRLHDRAYAGAPLTILDVATLDAAAGEVGGREWLIQLDTALADPSGTVVLRHIDDLPTALVAPFTNVLDAPRARLTATVSDRAGDRNDLAPVLERFAVVLDVPPLRERAADLPALITEIIADLHPRSPRPRCTPEALATLAGGDWPGNLRQLRQALATALAGSVSADITVDDLPGDLAAARLRHLTKLERLERQALVIALRDAGWDREAAARDLGISRATVYRKLKRFGIPATAHGQSHSAPDGS